jgi:hypothetical protein
MPGTPSLPLVDDPRHNLSLALVKDPSASEMAKAVTGVAGVLQSRSPFFIAGQSTRPKKELGETKQKPQFLSHPGGLNTPINAATPAPSFKGVDRHWKPSDGITCAEFEGRKNKETRL